MEQRPQSDSGIIPAPPATILIVDDEKVIRELCARALGSYRVVQADNCTDALRLYEKESCDLVLTDVMMPGGSGIDLLRQIKELNPNAVVVIMTGFSDKEIILNALKEGADDFISKPLNLLQLKTAMEKALGRKHLKEELANLKRLDRLKSNFLSLISHKLRTPITSISLFLQNIQQGLYEPQDPMFQKTAKLINDEAAYLGLLVAELLTFSKMMIGSEGLDREECDLAGIVNMVLQKNDGFQNRVSVRLDSAREPLPILYLDRSRIEFVFKQIIENAIKFSGEAEQIVIDMFKEGEKAVVIVADTGIGIPRAEIPKVFEKFYQIDPHNTGQVRGFGLGLFYAREFVRQHGGNITIDSEPGLGTAVTIMLPLQ